MLRYLEQIGCSAATSAISYRGKVVFSRGYGWSAKGVPTQPNTLIGIASCEKPITAAAIKKLARDKQLDLGERLFKFLKIRPRGPIVDDRINDITIRHLLDHNAGWGGNPVDAAVEAAESANVHLKAPYSVEILLSFIATQKLQNNPGEKKEYCNIGYDILRHILKKVTGKPCCDYYQNQLFKPKTTCEFYTLGGTRGPDAPPLVWNAKDGMPVAASARALCMFTHHYWFGGEPRDNGNGTWASYGSLPGSTSMMEWCPNGIDFAAVFNGRNDTEIDVICKEFEAEINRTRARILKIASTMPDPDR